VSTLTIQPVRVRWAPPPWQPPPGDGLVAVVSRSAVTGGWAESLLARQGDRQYVWAPLGCRPEQQAMEIAAGFGATVATLARGGADARQTSVALQVASWLSKQREARGMPGTCLTAWCAPQVPAGAVRVPHLVSVQRHTLPADVVVWELTDAASAREQVGLPSGAEFVESHLGTLLWLRAAVRERRLPATPLARRLLDILDVHGNELSTEVVYRNGELFRLLLDAWRGAHSGRGGVAGGA